LAGRVVVVSPRWTVGGDDATHWLRQTLGEEVPKRGVVNSIRADAVTCVNYLLSGGGDFLELKVGGEQL
jgi:hypothetical protein